MQEKNTLTNSNQGKKIAIISYSVMWDLLFTNSLAASSVSTTTSSSSSSSSSNSSSSFVAPINSTSTTTIKTIITL